MKKDHKKPVLPIIINTYLVLSTTVILIYGIMKGAGAGQVGDNMYGWGYLKAFTNLSNLFAGIVAAISLIYSIRQLRQPLIIQPRLVVVLKYTACTAVGLTFLTVALFLGPMFAVNGRGYFTLFSEEMLFFHLINPILSIVELIFFEKEQKLTLKDNWIALLPTLLYSALYTTMVIFLGKWNDFYNFTFGGHYELSPISFIVMIGITYGVAYLLRRLHNK